MYVGYIQLFDRDTGEILNESEAASKLVATATAKLASQENITQLL